jgi:hypothetical protein
MTALLATLALKATLWTVFCYLAALAIPTQHVRARRMATLVGLWGLWIVPWLPFPAVAGRILVFDDASNARGQRGAVDSFHHRGLVRWRFVPADPSGR